MKRFIELLNKYKKYYVVDAIMYLSFIITFLLMVLIFG